MTGAELIQYIEENDADDLEVFRLTDYGSAEQYQVEDIMIVERDWGKEKIILID